MPIPVRKPPTPELVAAVSSVSSKTSFQSAYFFSIQPLVALCDPHFGFHAIHALNLGVVPRLSPALVKFYQDSEISRCILRIFTSMTCQLADDGSKDEIARFVHDQGYESTVQWIEISDLSSVDSSLVESAVQIIKYLQQCGASINPGGLGLTMMAKIQGQLPPVIAVHLLAVLKTCCRTTAGIREIGAAHGTETLLKYLSSVHTAKNTESTILVQTLLDGLQCVNHLVAAGQWSKDDLPSVIFLADLYRGNPKIKAEIAALLSQMYTMDDLEKCLETLRKSAPGSAEHKESLSMLTPMSYVTDFADSLVISGGIPYLVHAVDVCVKNLEEDPKSQESVRGLTGGCKMLGAIAVKGTNIAAIIKAGGLKTSISALKVSGTRAGCVAAAASMATPLVSDKAHAEQFISENGIAVIIKALIPSSSTPEMLSAIARLLETLASHRSLCAQLGTQSMFKSLVSVTTTDTPVVVVAEVWSALAKIATGVTTCEPLITAKAINSIEDQVMTRKNEPSLLSAAAHCLSAYCQVSDAPQALQATPAAKVLLTAISKVPAGSPVEKEAIEGLKRIATSQDLDRILNVLRNQFKNVDRETEDCVNTLRSVGALAQCPNLVPILQQQKIGFEVLNLCASLMDRKAFPKRGDVIEASIPIVISIEMSLNEPIEGVLKQLMNFMTSEAFKKDREMALEKLPVVLDQTQVLLSSNRFHDDMISSVIEACLDVMKKFPEGKMINLSAIQILSELVKTRDARAARKIVDVNAHETCLTYARKVRMFEDVQLAVFELLELILIADSKLTSNLRTPSAIEGLRAAQAAHGKSASVKRVLSSVAGKLMPSDYLEKQIQGECQALQQSVESDNWVRGKESISTIAAYVSTAEGQRIALKLAVSSTLAIVTDKLPKCSDRTLAAMYATQIAYIAKEVTNTLPGAKTSAKQGLIDSLIVSVDILCTDTSANAEAICCALAALRTLLRAVGATGSDSSIRLGDSLKKFCEASTGDAVSLTKVAEFMVAASSDATAQSSASGTILHFLLGQLASKEPKYVIAAAEALVVLARDVFHQRVLMPMKAEEITMTALRKHEKDLDVVGSLGRLLQALCRPGDKALAALGQDKLTQRIEFVSGLIPSVMEVSTVEALMSAILAYVSSCPACHKLSGNSHVTAGLKRAKEVCADSPEMLDYISRVLKAIGGEQAGSKLIAQMIRIAGAIPAGWDKQMESLCEEMSIYLQGRFRNMADVYAKATDLAECLRKVMEYNPNLVHTDGAAVATLEGLVRAAPPKHPVLAAIIGKSAIFVAGKLTEKKDTTWQKDRRCVCRGFGLFEQLLLRPETVNAAIKLVDQFELGSQAYQLMRTYEDDSEVVVRIQRFVNALAATPEGLAVLERQIHTKKFKMENIMDGMLEVTNPERFRGRRGIADLVAGADLLSKLDRTAAKRIIMRPEMIQHLENVGKLSIGHQLAVAAFWLASRCPLDPAIMDKFKKMVEKIRLDWQSDYLNDDARADVVVEMVRLLARSAKDKDSVQMLQESGMLDLARDVFGTATISDNVIFGVAPLWKHCLLNKEVTEVIVSSLLPGIFKAAGQSANEEVLATVLADCLLTLRGFPDVIQTVTKLMNYKSFIQACAKAASHNPELALLLDEWRGLVDNFDTQGMSLRKLLSMYKKEIQAKRSLKINANPVIKDNMRFLIENLRTLATTEINDADNEVGEEFNAGLECLSILHQESDNALTLGELSEEAFLIEALQYQTNQLVIYWVAKAARDATRHDLIAQQFARAPKSKEVVVNILQTGVHAQTDRLSADELNACRLQLFRQTVRSRQQYNGTGALKALLDYWDAVDAGGFTPEILKLTFQGLRAIINPEVVPELQEAKVPERLSEIVKQSNPEILPDTFYLIGSLGNVPSLKQRFGQLGVVESTLKFVKEQKDNVGDTALKIDKCITNALLSVGTLAIGHTENARKFLELQGLDTTVDILDSANDWGRRIFEVVNATSILLTNISFRRDDVKQKLGDMNAPQAVMETMETYVSDMTTNDQLSQRCLVNMFKAISNLCLYPPNVKKFLDGDISKTLTKFFKDSDSMSADLLEVGSRCLSNMLLETSDANLKTFGSVIPPLLASLKSQQENQVTNAEEFFAFGLQSLAALARIRAHAEEIIRRGGIITLSKLILHCKAHPVTSQAVCVVSALSKHDDLYFEVVDQGGLKTVINVLHAESNADEAPYTETCLNGLVALRRLIKEDAINNIFWEEEGMVILCRLLKKTPNQPSVQTEGFRLILQIISLYPDEEPEDTDKDPDDWSGEVAEEGLSPLEDQIQRPLSPRKWESAMLQESDLVELIEAACQTIGEPSSIKQHKLQKTLLGFLSYCACEKVKGTMFAFLNGNFFDNCLSVMQNFRTDPLILDFIYTITVNVCSVANLACWDAIRESRRFIAQCGKISKDLMRGPDPLGHIGRNYAELWLALKDDKTMRKDFWKWSGFDFELKRTEFDVDKYPRGVSDLPAEIRNGLLAGGSCRLLNERSFTGDIMAWKASADFSRFTYHIGDKIPDIYSKVIVMSRFRSLVPGLGTLTLQLAHRRNPFQCTESTCLSLIGSKSEDSPHGLELNMRFKSQIDRDHFVYLFEEWRDARIY